ncbi:MAG: hypothetical protein R3E91_00350 [Chlamydiales bacterium]
MKKGLEWFNTYNSGTLSIDKIHLSWFGSQQINNFSYKDKDFIFTIKELETKTPLFYLIFGGKKIGFTTVNEPILSFKREEETLKKDERCRKKKWRDYRFLINENFSIFNGRIDFQINQEEMITISEIHSEYFRQSNLYSIKAHTKQGMVEGISEIQISYDLKTQAEGQLKNFPSRIINWINNWTDYTELLGKTIDVSFNCTEFKKNEFCFASEIHSQNLNGVIKGEIKEKKFFIDTPIQFSLMVSPKFFHSILPENKKESYSLAHHVNIQLEIQKGVFPLSFQQSIYSNMILEANGKIDQAEIKIENSKHYLFKDLSIFITHSNQTEVSYQGKIERNNQSGSLSGNIVIKGKESIGFSSNFQNIPFAFINDLSNAIEKNMQMVIDNHLDLEIEGAYEQGKLSSVIKVTIPSLEIKGILKGKLNHLNFDISGYSHSEENLAIYLGEIIEFKISGLIETVNGSTTISMLNGTISNSDYQIKIQGIENKKFSKENTDDLEFVIIGEVIQCLDRKELIDLKKGHCLIKIDRSMNKIYGELSIETELLEQETIDTPTFFANFEITNYLDKNIINLKKASVYFDANFYQFSISLLNQLIFQKTHIKNLIEGKFDTSLQGKYNSNHDSQFCLNLQTEGEDLKADLSIILDDHRIIFQNGSSLDWNLTPQKYSMMIDYFYPEEKPLLNLVNPARLRFNIKELISPVKPKSFREFFTHTKFLGDFTLGTLVFSNPNTENYLTINNTIGFAREDHFSKEIVLHLQGDIFAENVPLNEKSTFEFNGKMVNWILDGNVNDQNLMLDGELNLKSIPVKLITEIYPMDKETKGLIQAILGEIANIRVYGTISKFTGPLNIAIDSSNLKANLLVSIDPHAIYLRDSINTEITLTSELSPMLIKDIHPLLITGISSNQSINIFIDAKNFIFPIRPYAFDKIEIERGVINIGKIEINNGEKIQQLMRFLKVTDITSEKEMSGWFTPIFMHLKEGILTCQRFDILLANEFHIALWGSINLMNKEIKMTLGIAPSTLKKRFNISGLSKNDMFQVKIRGSTDQLELDWSSAAKRIGILIAKTAGGHIGAIIGTIVEQIIWTLGEGRTPPPTSYPFPWEEE